MRHNELPLVAMSRLDSTGNPERQFRLAKISGGWQRWILETPSPWETPPWHPLAAAVIRARTRKTQDIKAVARQFFDDELRVVEEGLRQRRQEAEGGDDPVGYSFTRIHDMFASDLLWQAREEFAEYVCLYEPEAIDGRVVVENTGGERDSPEPWYIRLRQRREKVKPHLSRRALAKKLLISESSVKTHEHGERWPSKDVRKAYVAYYGVPEGELFYDAVEQPERPQTPKKPQNEPDQ
jgi:hypothetical protein